MAKDERPLELTPELILSAYAQGIFPMAESREEDELFWLDPEFRGVLPLDGFHISRSLRKTILREPFQIKIDTDFAGVIEGCADRAETWINAPIFSIYMDLFHAGHAHSVEVWDGKELVGGVYGVTLNGAFFGESMFSRRRDASKIALAYLVSRLNAGGFKLLDTQFLTPHLASLGGVEIPRASYRRALRDALSGKANFLRQPLTVSGHQVCT
ncbi:leucyl/phenylalanyl-tRNA--protein transferase [Litoreibacter ascidiaceicola]|uniref:Leucyl/phenylalanyl-tRNA--protein transferase n=1 Tax=Litoreibacter ascidiaceicola TaxID=1486859 RepID=A0A1M4SXK7_9RHOB|nr:leucyl/phenylalanyl-tRNA--protein transferase [Litoreibacter ascidiaceicola]SHE36961.1 leucyl/phenylalanyl-tRNA--protein transferase [Litoreibacter ascidiaceicola]